MDIELLRASVTANAETDFSRSSGPGGQNVNKVNTKVTTRIRIAAIEGLSPSELELMRTRLANRITTEGELVVQVQEERSQSMNREKAIEKLISLVARAAKRAPPRIPTKPTKASKERKLAHKKIRSSIKKNRQSPPVEG
ncbi:MAG: alternative ribosome rescue aminoacyl-tRNA hydrolase ArfB [Rectinema sp.]